ncbi:hypothetical protein TrST_g5929 [Triparma strigata]|uniref:STAS domain-containing protein n=1 Tax=Triparma strigata TaxID=1606541 RepID=A0A9W7EFN0_9STRA|nr:hypothetical protein TrST_g5929 [Triparma strigata]
MHLGIYNTAYETTYPERKRKKIKVATGNYAVGMMIFMGTGSLPWIQNAAGLSIYKSYGIKSNTSYVISQVMFFFIGYYDFKVLRFVPKVVFTLLLGVAGWGLIDVYGIRTYSKTPFLHYLPIPLFCLISYFFSSTVAIGALLVIACCGFLYVQSGGSVVRYLANGLTVRSTVERGEVENNILNTRGDLIQCFFLQGSIFFGNGKSRSVKKYVQTMFDDVEKKLPERLVEMLPPKPACLVLDFSLVISLDVSAAEVFKEIVSLCSRNSCKCYVAGAEREVMKILIMQDMENVSWSKTFDEAMTSAEEHALTLSDIIRTSAVPGFEGSLLAIERQQNLKGLTEKLEPFLKPLVKELVLKPGESVYSKARSVYGANAGTVDVERGLFFIESGHIKVQKPSNQTMTRGGTLRREINNLSQGGSVGGKDARGLEIGRAGMKKKGMERGEQTFRLASMGPGWVLGCREVSGGLKFNGSYIACTPCKLHYLPLSALDELTEYSPQASLTLYKMMAHLVAKNLESAIAQIDSFKNVIGGRGEGKPTKRETWARINDAMLKMHVE